LRKLTILLLSTVCLVSLATGALACKGDKAETASAKNAKACTQTAKTACSEAATASASCTKTANAGACDHMAEAGCKESSLPIDMAWASIENGVVIYYSSPCPVTTNKLKEMAQGGEKCCPFAAKMAGVENANIKFGVTEGGVFAVITSDRKDLVESIQADLASYAADD
jgi:hypothetical protein